MSMLGTFFSKTKNKNAVFFIAVIFILQFGYVNLIDQKMESNSNHPINILNSATLASEWSQKRIIKPPTLSVLSMNDHQSCQIQSNHIKCKNKDSTTAESILTPPQLPLSISSTQDYSCLINKDGGVQCWSHNSQIENFKFVSINLPGLVLQLSSNNNETCSLIKSGEVFCWRKESKDFSPPLKKFLTADAITSISSFGLHHCATNEIGNVICWGEKYTNRQSATTQIQIREKAIQVSTGPNQDCIITKKNRELICWTSNFSNLSKAPNLSNLHEVSLSENLSCGLTFEGSVYCWQKMNLTNLKLQLNPAAGETSKLISMSSNKKEICALTDNQRVICWK